MDSIFEEENEHRVENIQDEVSKTLDRKTVDINKRLNNIFDLDDENENPILIKPPQSRVENNEIKNSSYTSNHNLISEDQSNKNFNFNKNKEEAGNKMNKIPIEESNSKTNLNKIITKTPEPIKEEKINGKADLNRLNKLFLFEEEELDFKNLNLKKEEKKIIIPQAKDFTESFDLIKNINNGNKTKNKLSELNDNRKSLKKNFILDEEDESNLSNKGNKNNIVGNSITKLNNEIVSNQINNSTKVINTIPNNNNLSNAEDIKSDKIKTNNNTNNTNINDPLTGELIQTKKPTSSKKKSVVDNTDPLSMMRNSAPFKLKNSSNNNINANPFIGSTNKLISDNTEKNQNEKIINNEINENTSHEKKEDETRKSRLISDMTKVRINFTFLVLFLNYFDFVDYGCKDDIPRISSSK